MAKRVFAHYMPSQPLNGNNAEPDYADTAWLTTTGEGGIHTQYGGHIRDAPAKRTDVTRPIPGDYELDDMREEVRRAKAYGLDGFIPDLLNLSGSANHLRAKKLFQACSDDGTLKTMICLDMNGTPGTQTQQSLCDAIVELNNYSSTYKLTSPNRTVITAFQAQNKDNAWWTVLFHGGAGCTGLEAAGITVAFIPMPTGLSTTIMDQFDALPETYGYTTWGARNPAGTAGLSTLAATMRARTGNAAKIWMAPVSAWDARPPQFVYDEPNGSQQLRDCWDQAISSATFADDLVQLVTWNDYPEGAAMSPTRRRDGALALDLTQYYAAKWKTGSFPTVTTEKTYVIHRPMKAPPMIYTTQALNSGTAYTAVAVQAITAANRPAAGDLLNLHNGQQMTVASQPAIGATSLAINSFTPSTTFGSNETLTKCTWSHAPAGGYKPMTNRRHLGTRGGASSSATETVDIVEVLTLLASPGDVTATVGGVAQTPYTAAPGLQVQTFPLATGAAPSAELTRSSGSIMTATSPSAVAASPTVQNMDYITGFDEFAVPATPTAATPTALLVWHVIGNQLTRRGRPDPRDGLVYGQYEPQAAGTSWGSTGVSCGLSNAGILTNHNSSATQTLTLTDGQTIQDKIVYGFLRPPNTHNTDIVIENCLLRGGVAAPTGDDAILKADLNRTGTGRVILRDCELWPQTAAMSEFTNGVRGHRVVVERCWIHDVVDGFIPYATTAMNSGNAFSYLYGSLIERLTYTYPDVAHSDGTHNDCVAVSGGKEMGIKGNLLRCTSIDLPGSGTNPTHPQLQGTNTGLGDGTAFAYGACVIITNTVSNPLNNTVIVEENYMFGGRAHLNVKPNMTCIVRNNKHYRTPYTISSDAQFWYRYDQRSGNGVVANNSTWIDGPYVGQVLIEPRDRGVHFNT
jgi:hypothetical protein